MILNIVTHNKTMHADEITAIALLKLFTKHEIIIHRVNHNTKDFSNYDLVIDIGRKFDGKKYFDHHQNRGGKSSAGLIWEYLGLKKVYPKISKLIKMIDDNDVGIQKAKEFEYSSLFKCFNIPYINSKKQDESFNNAVSFSLIILTSIKNKQDGILLAKEIVDNSTYFKNFKSVFELKIFTPFWSTYINSELMPDIKAVVWRDIEDNTYKVKLTAKRVTSFENCAKELKQDKRMDFVHSAGFFAVARNCEVMIDYLEDNLM